jgi:hypothetical protein
MINNNLSSKLLAALFFLIFVFVSQTFSQEEVVMDSVITGVKYRITLYNDKEVIGKVMKQDSVYIYLVNETGTVRVRNEDIFSVSRSTIPSLLKALFTLGGGIMLGSGNHHGYSNENKPGYSLQLTGLYPFSENKAIRLDLSFGQFKRNWDDYYLYYEEHPSTHTGQTVNIYQAYADFVFGDFSTRSKFSVYGLAGVGILNISEGSYDYTYYDSYDSAYVTSTYPGYNHTSFSMAIGGGMRIKLSSRLGIFAEAQYNVSTYEGYFFFFGGGYFPLRAGLTYTFY